jgi:hypothetical protein
MAPRYPPVPEPSTDLVSLRSTALALKETAEILTGNRGNRSLSVVTWQDLVDLGLILPSQVPITPSNR